MVNFLLEKDRISLTARKRQTIRKDRAQSLRPKAQTFRDGYGSLTTECRKKIILPYSFWNRVFYLGEDLLKMKKTLNINGKLYHRIIALLDREQIDYLDKLSKDALFSTGTKLPRTRIISALVDTLKLLNLNAEGIKSEEELVERILEKLEKSDK